MCFGGALQLYMLCVSHLDYNKDISLREKQWLNNVTARSFHSQREEIEFGESVGDQISFSPAVISVRV